MFLGSQAGYSNTTGTGNLFLGQQAGTNNSTASYNLFMGNGSGSNTTTGGGNTAIGDGAMLGNTSGQNNTSIGRYAGINNTSGFNNTFIGVAASSPAGTGALSNATAIGYNTSVTVSNALILGSGVNVGIGNTAPANKLEITQGSAGNSGFRFTNLTSASPATALNQTKFLSVNASGDVILASSNGSARLGAENWTLAEESLQNTNAGGVIIGQGVQKTPAGYKLFVEEGILTEKVKVAVRNTSDWSDHVFSAGYGLKPLAEVESYIQVHQHLPGVPSAQQMVEQGNDLHKTDAKLLEKIEELTLYSIQLEKELTIANQNQQRLQHKVTSMEARQANLELLLNQFLKR